MEDLLLPPQSVEVEEAILGGILIDDKAIARVLDLLDPEAFYLNRHRLIYRAALDLHRCGEPTDFMSVTDRLKNGGELEIIGGFPAIASMVERTISAANIEAYARLVMDKYRRRQLMRVGGEIHQLARDLTRPLDDLLGDAERFLFEVSQEQPRRRSLHNSDIAFAAFNELDCSNPIYPTGLKELDNLLIGFEPGTLSLLAGRPSMGKSQCALLLALNMAIAHDLPVLFFSLEMTALQLQYRLWSLLTVHPAFWRLELSRLKSDRIRQHRAGTYRLSERELMTIAELVEVSAKLPLYFNEDRGITATGMASECRRFISSGKKIGLVVIDYLQMMAGDSKSGNRSYELGDVARELYKMAGDLNIPILALSQISRAVENRNNKRPMLSDLSQSGILEMVADNVIMAYRDDYYNPGADEGVLELIVGKARHGVTGTAKCFFDKSYGLLANLEDRHE